MSRTGSVKTRSDGQPFGLAALGFAQKAARCFDALACRLSLSGAVLAMVIMVLMCCHIIVEITLRTLFDSSTHVLDEFVGYGIAAMTFLAMGRALSQQVLIRVTLLLDTVKFPALRLGMQIACLLLTAGLVSYLIIQFWTSVLRNFQRGATSETMAEVPLWLPESLLLLGLSIFVLQLLSGAMTLLTGLPKAEAPAD
ncbi:TRAP transporter small permease [Leisingera daeponensis]|uniref:TRAP transporter small permease n=1 Tax=Leisingera daeponensis TaxID=405746 RepID=UPI001C9867A1|nr:TRAP transporter small permease subunit [Leisingera daeponensis]MBY6058740.1 TRAP transporter small permease [Leisingera daeponensis]